jgi:hypothetical protein
MLFAYTHGICDSYLIWPVVAVTFISLMWILPPVLGALHVPAALSRFLAWIVLVVLIMAAPLLLPAGAPLMLTEFALGVVFSLYYVSMTQALKGVAWPLGLYEAGERIESEIKTGT